MRFDANELFMNKPRYDVDFDQEIDGIAHDVVYTKRLKYGWRDLTEQEKRLLTARYLYQKLESRGVEDLLLVAINCSAADFKKILIKCLLADTQDIHTLIVDMIASSAVLSYEDVLSEMIDDQINRKAEEHEGTCEPQKQNWDDLNNWFDKQRI